MPAETLPESKRQGLFLFPSSHSNPLYDQFTDRREYKSIAVYAVKTNRTEDAVTFDEAKAEVLKEIYRRLNRMDVHTEHITVKETHLETQEGGSVVPVEQEVVKTYLCIDTVSLTAEEAANLYGFDTKQREQLGELLSDRNKEMWDALLLQR